MIGRIDYLICRQEYPCFPLVDNQKDIFLFPKVFQTRILTISSKTAKAHAQNLSKELDRLFNLIGTENIIFLENTGVLGGIRTIHIHPFKMPWDT